MLLQSKSTPGPAGRYVHGPPAPGEAEMTVPDSRPGRAPGMSGRAQARSAIPRISAGFTAIGVLPVPSVARLSPVACQQRGQLTTP